MEVVNREIQDSGLNWFSVDDQIVVASKKQFRIAVVVHIQPKKITDVRVTQANVKIGGTGVLFVFGQSKISGLAISLDMDCHKRYALPLPISRVME